MNKSEIVHLLAEQCGYRRCLVLRSALTGPDVAVDPTRFDLVVHVVYGAGSGYITVAQNDFYPDNFVFDIALVDPWHTYSASNSDLVDAWSLIRPGGALVCHDCFPPDDPKIIDPDGFPTATQPWSGVTYQAWTEFAISSGYAYWTVDCDFGCGVIMKVRPTPTVFQAAVLAWDKSHTLATAKPLINLITPEAFRKIDFGKLCGTQSPE